MTFGGAGWPDPSGGRSLELVDPASDNNLGSSWALSTRPAGSPGAPNQTAVAGSPPGAPTIGTSVAGAASATVRWTAPANTGGSAVTGYQVRVLDSAGQQVAAAQPASPTVTSLVVTGLAVGTPYEFQVAAINAAGVGTASTMSNLGHPDRGGGAEPPGDRHGGVRCRRRDRHGDGALDAAHLGRQLADPGLPGHRAADELFRAHRDGAQRGGRAGDGLRGQVQIDDAHARHVPVRDRRPQLDGLQPAVHQVEQRRRAVGRSTSDHLATKQDDQDAGAGAGQLSSTPAPCSPTRRRPLTYRKSIVSSLDNIEERYGDVMDRQPPSRAVSAAYVIVTALLTLVLAGAVVEIVLAAVGAVRGDHAITVARTVPPDQLGPLPPDVRAPGYVPVVQTVRNASPGQLALRVAIDLAPLLLVVPGLWLLRTLLGSLRRGDPFSVANVQRLRSLGVLLLLGSVLVSLLTHVLQEALVQTAPAGDTLAGPDWAPIPVPALLAGLGVLVLAELFAHGARLREDVEGTI